MRRYSHGYRGHRSRGSGGAEKWIGVGIFLVVLGSAGTKTAATVVHHHTSGGNATTPHVAAVTSGSETAFWRAMLADMGAPATAANLASLEAWLPHEQPWPSLATWNPLDSTQPMPGSTVYNSVGVQNYPTASEGAEADARTLENGYYPSILAALRNGSGVCGSSFAGEFATWSGGGYQEVC